MCASTAARYSRGQKYPMSMNATLRRESSTSAQIVAAICNTWGPNFEHLQTTMLANGPASLWQLNEAMSGFSEDTRRRPKVPDHLMGKPGDFIIYGEPLFAEAVADQLGLLLLEPPIDWLTSIPRELKSRDVAMTTLAEARPETRPQFVKPADGKIFDPKVYQSGTELPTEDHVDGSIPVLCSGIVDFRLEVRCFVHQRKVLTLSPYWRDDALAERDGGWPFETAEKELARDFATKVCESAEVGLPPACTVDVGRLADGSWAVIEANPCWGAGLYGCDPALVLSALRSSIVRADEATDSDRKWVSKRRMAVESASTV